MQMELELKAIYAQINPHFIFNSLNAALLLVRKKRLTSDTSYSPIFRLLRSYLKSSENKFITITDEIVNLQGLTWNSSKHEFAEKFDLLFLLKILSAPERKKYRRCCCNLC